MIVSQDPPTLPPFYRGLSLVKTFLVRIPLRARRQVITFCSEMYEGFVNVAKEVFGHGRILIDRFHVPIILSGVSSRPYSVKKPYGFSEIVISQSLLPPLC